MMPQAPPKTCKELQWGTPPLFKKQLFSDRGSSDQQHQRHQETCQRCKFSAPSDLLVQRLWSEATSWLNASSWGFW